MSDRYNVPLKGNGGPRELSLHPINAGIIRDLPSNRLPPGGLVDCRNYIVKSYGLYRRPARVKLIDEQLTYGAVRDIIPYRTSEGVRQTLVMDDKFLYLYTGTAYEGQYWTYGSGTVATSGTTVTGSGSPAWESNNINAGDVIVLDADGSGDGPESVEITSVDSDTQLTLTSTPSGTFAAGTDYEIRRAFKRNGDNLFDWVVLPAQHTVLITDGSRPVWKWDGANLTANDASDTFIPLCIGAHRDRVLAGYTNESGTIYRQRYRFTKLTDPDNFDVSGGIQVNDLPYSAGYLRRIVPLGPIVVFYLTDAVWFGRALNDPNIPWAVERIETGGQGLVGTKAVHPWRDGHVVVMEDDIYFLGADVSLTPIGSRVVKDTIRATTNLWNTWVSVDTEHDRLVVGFPDDASDNMTKVWSYEYKADAWSYDELTSTMLSYNEFVDSDTWEEGVGTYDSDTSSWDEQAVQAKRLWYGHDRYVYYLTSLTTQDESSSNIMGRFETGDLDFGLPDRMKTVTRISMKVDEVVDADVVFTISVSTDLGDSFTELGTLTIAAGTTEDHLSFLKTGSTFRFKATSNSAVVPYSITDVVLRVKARGVESHLPSGS